MKEHTKYQNRLSNSVDKADMIGQKIGVVTGKISWKLVIGIITIITIAFFSFIQFFYGFGKGFKNRTY